MRAYEVTKALMEGKKVRGVDWIDDHYVYLKDNVVIDDEGNESVALLRLFDREWEIYDERKELPSQLNWLKDAEIFFKSDEDCIVDDCEDCPLQNKLSNRMTICGTFDSCMRELRKIYKI